MGVDFCIDVILLFHSLSEIISFWLVPDKLGLKNWVLYKLFGI